MSDDDNIDITEVVDPTQRRLLGTTFNKNGYTYEQVLRDGNIAIFKQRLRPGVGELAYETIIIQIKPAVTIKGKFVPEREAAPSDEAFGTLGWSYPTLERAKAKFHELLKARSVSTTKRAG